jgi:hypothetical protein
MYARGSYRHVICGGNIAQPSATCHIVPHKQVPADRRHLHAFTRLPTTLALALGTRTHTLTLCKHHTKHARSSLCRHNRRRKAQESTRGIERPIWRVFAPLYLEAEIARSSAVGRGGGHTTSSRTREHARPRQHCCPPFIRNENIVKRVCQRKGEGCSGSCGYRRAVKHCDIVNPHLLVRYYRCDQTRCLVVTALLLLLYSLHCNGTQRAAAQHTQLLLTLTLSCDADARGTTDSV